MLAIMPCRPYNNAMVDIKVVPGTPGLRLCQVAHVVPIGRGRDKTGHSINHFTAARVEHAVAVYVELRLAEKNGLFCCSGGATPFDKNGQPWSHPMRRRLYRGRPEATSMIELARELGIPEGYLREEPDSWDTLTNLIFTEERRLLGDDRPTAIVGHEEHLVRALKIAQRISTRPFIGIAVPEGQVRDRDTWQARLATNAMLTGLRPDLPNVYDRACRQSRWVWRCLGQRVGDYAAQP